MKSAIIFILTALVCQPMHAGKTSFNLEMFVPEYTFDKKTGELSTILEMKVKGKLKVHPRTIWEMKGSIAFVPNIPDEELDSDDIIAPGSVTNKDGVFDPATGRITLFSKGKYEALKKKETEAKPIQMSVGTNAVIGDKFKIYNSSAWPELKQAFKDKAYRSYIVIFSPSLYVPLKDGQAKEIGPTLNHRQERVIITWDDFKKYDRLRLMKR